MKSKNKIKKNLDKRLTNLKKLLLKFKLPNLITFLLLFIIWLYKDRQDETDEQLDELEESKFFFYFKLLRLKLINFVTFFLIPLLVIIYNLINSDLIDRINQFSQDNFLINLFFNIYNFFTNNDDEFDKLNSKDNDKLYKKYDITIERIPFEIENLRLEFKKELKQLKIIVDKLNQDNDKTNNLTNRLQLNNDLKIERFEKKLIEIINDELCKVKDLLLDKINNFQQKYSFLDSSNFDKFCEMFDTADITVDLISRRDQQLKDLFKATTEMNIKNEIVDDELKKIKKAYLDLVNDIKSNNEDLAKYIEDIKQITEDNLSNKFKNDRIKILNEIENLRADNNIKEKDYSKLNSLVNNIENNFNSIKKKFSEYDEKIKHCTKEIDEFRDIIENLTIYLNTDITGKINGILKFLGREEL